MAAVLAADDIPLEDIHHHHIGPTAAAGADGFDNVDAASCAHRHWNSGCGCPCGYDHVSWRSGMMTHVVGHYFRPRQNSDCALKTELGVAMEEPMMPWWWWFILMLLVAFYGPMIILCLVVKWEWAG